MKHVVYATYTTTPTCTLTLSERAVRLMSALSDMKSARHPRFERTARALREELSFWDDCTLTYPTGYTVTAADRTRRLHPTAPGKGRGKVK